MIGKNVVDGKILQDFEKCDLWLIVFISSTDVTLKGFNNCLSMSILRVSDVHWAHVNAYRNTYTIIHVPRK